MRQFIASKLASTANLTTKSPRLFALAPKPQAESKEGSAKKLQLEVDRENVRRYLRGDDRAFAEIAKVARIAIGIAVSKKNFYRSSRHKEDIEQELMLHLVRRIRDWEPSRGSLLTFICKIFENRAKEVAQSLGRFDQRELTSTREIGITEAHELQDDWRAMIRSRLFTDAENYVLRNICTAVYLGIYDKQAARIRRHLIKAVTC